jgi:ERCC4-type nuclease
MEMNKIQVRADSNESGNSRMAKLGLALADDPRFEWAGYDSLDVDLQFRKTWEVSDDRLGDSIFNVELKEPADYIASALSPSGHLYSQVLSLRESGHPCMILVLGGDDEVHEAIKDSLVTRYRGKELGFQISSYGDRLIDFESQCEALGCPVRRWRSLPWKRLLSTAHKILTGGNLTGYRPRPADGERELIAAATLFKGIGPETCKTLLEDYSLKFVPRSNKVRSLDELPGIGPKRAQQIAKFVVYGLA